MPLTVAQLTARLTADTSNFYRGMALANASMLRTGGLITRVAAGAGLATLGIGIMSLRAAGNFEQSMNIFGAVSDATGAQMKAVRGEALALGKDMTLPKVSAKDAAISMTELAKGGLSVKDAMSAARGTLELGVAANIAYSDSAAIVARALTSFHLEGSKATQVADLFTAAANKSTASAGDIALGFQAASAQFHAGDQTIQGLTTSLTLMANAGIVGSDAGTSLKTMMNRLMAPTKKAKGLMDGLGISIYDQAGNMRPMPDLIGQFNKGMAGMSKEQRNAALYTIFGSDAIRAARVQMDAGAAGWTNMEEKLTKGGEAQKFATAATKGFNGALDNLMSVAETLAIQLGTALLPAATNVARAIANFIGNIDPAKIIAFFSAISDGVKWVYDLVKGSTLLQAILVGLLAGFIAFQVVTGIVEAVTAAWAILNAVMAVNPFILIAAALIALGAGLYFAYQRSETFRNIVNAAFDSVRSAANKLFEVGAIIIKAFSDAYNFVANIVRQIVSVVTSAWNAIHSNTAVWNAISAIVKGAWNIIKAIITADIAIIKAVISGAWGVIQAVTTAAWNIMKAIVVNAIGVITGRISAFTAVRNIISAIWDGVKSVTTAAWNAIKGVVTAALSGIRGILSAEISAAGSIAVAIGSAIVQGILSGITGLAEAVGAKISAGVHGAIGIAKGALGIGSPSKVAADEVGKPIGQGIIQGFLDGTVDLPSKIKSTLKNALEAGKKEVEAAKADFQTAFSRLGDYASQAFDAATSGHVTHAQRLLDALVSRHDQEELKQRLADAQAKVKESQQAITDFATQTFDSDAERAAKGKELYQNYLDAVAAVQKEKDDQAYAAKVASLTATSEREKLEYDARRALQKQHLEDSLADLEANLMKHPEKYQFYQNQIIKLLNSYGINYKSSGHLLGAAFAQGLREAEEGILAEARRIAAKIAAILKLKSPAKEGPLSDLNQWWASFAPTLLSSLNAGSIQDALVNAVTPAGNGMAALATGGAAPVQEVHYHILENGGTVIGTRLDQAAIELRDAIHRHGVRTGDSGL